MQQPAEKRAIVLAAFGTSYPEAIHPILKLLERIRGRFDPIPVKLALTSNVIRRKWTNRLHDKRFRAEHPALPDEIYEVKSTLATLALLRDEGYRHIAVQSAHIFAGEEYQNLKNELEALAALKALRERDKPFRCLALGRPALGEPGDVFPYRADIAAVAAVLGDDVVLAKANASALVYMGHGNEIFSTGAYVEFEAAMRERHPHVPIFVGNVEGFPAKGRLVSACKQAGVKRVTMLPFMLIAGDHALNDMASDEEDSWKVAFESAKIEVIPVVRGLGELPAIAELFIDHLYETMDRAGLMAK